VLDKRLVEALHVQALRREGLAPEHEPHVVFQASTIGALLEGAYEGDVTFAELAEHGDLGLGTLNALDGEMIAVDGRFFRADLAGTVHKIDSSARTPFAVLVWFSPTVEFEVQGALSQDELEARIDAALPAGTAACAVRVDGEFDTIRARSVGRQRPPYRPLGEVVKDQQVFEVHDVRGTIVGFRFPDYSEGVEVSGYHLHFISEDRRRGGHVLDCNPRRAFVRLDPSTDLHLELPPGLDLASPELTQAARDALARAEHSG